MLVDDLTLIKILGKGSFGEVYLSTKKGRKELFATKKIEKEIAERPSFINYFKNEIFLLQNLKHPNIVKLVDIKKTNQSYYLVMEYVNGGGLSDCLKKYKEKYGKPFPEEIIQHLMRQIIDALYYIHKQNIIHRDLKLDNIMVNFDSEEDKKNLNLMKATIKIIDFGFATMLTAKNNFLAFTAVGTLNYMDPIIVNKFAKKKDQSLGYDQKADIWSTGAICYELLIGKPVFDAKSLDDLVEKVEAGNYKIPTSVSKEVVSFLNGMLQYDSKERLGVEDLRIHPFLTKNTTNFIRIGTERATKKQKTNLKNKSIWSIFNDEEKYTSIPSMNSISKAEKEQGGNKLNPKNQVDNELIYNNKPKSSKNIDTNFAKNNNIINKNYNKTLTMKDFSAHNYHLFSFYGQNMHPTSQISKSGTISMPPPQQNPTVGSGMSQNAGFYNNQQKMPAQGNLLRLNTFQGPDPNRLFKGI